MQLDAAGPTLLVEWIGFRLNMFLNAMRPLIMVITIVHRAAGTSSDVNIRLE